MSYQKQNTNDSLAIYRNPFAYVDGPAKIPDNATPYSISFREQLTFQFNSGSGEDISFFSLLPSWYAGFTYQYFDNSLPSSALNVNSQFTTNGAQALYNGPSNTFQHSLTSLPVKYIRLVSAGVKLSCSSNASNNNGSFEAIRTSVHEDNDIVTFANMPNDTSYVCGKLHEIDDYQFQLKPLNTDHPFIDARPFQLDAVLATERNLTFKDFFDPSFDVVNILIKSTDRVDVVAHTIHNFEVIFDSDALISRYHTPSFQDMYGLDKAQSYLLKSNKATKRSLK